MERHLIVQEVAQQLYHLLPAPARSLAATCAGWRVRWRRYGMGFDSCVRRLRPREGWTRQQWEAYQRRELAWVLEQAGRRVPYYRASGAQRRLGTQPEDLGRWPILEKPVVRARPLDFVAEGRRRLLRIYTSGTTGTPLLTFRSAATERLWYAMFEIRVRHRWGVRWNDRWALFGGRLVVPASRRDPPFWVVNRGLNQLYLSSYHLSPRVADTYLDALVRFRPTHLVGYTSALSALAEFVLMSGRTDLRPRVVITNAEPLYDHQKAAMARAFSCPVVETYGMTEMGVAASACHNGQLHTWPDLGYLEILDHDGQPAAPGQVGEVVTTGLLNVDQPLIRYRTGDLAVAAPDDFRCPCGNEAPVLARVEGRNDHVLVTADGRRVGRLDPVFKGALRILEAQIVQLDLNAFAIRYVPGPGCDVTDTDRMVKELRDRIGDVSVHLESVDAIERNANGKFRAVVSRLSEDRRARANTTHTP